MSRSAFLSARTGRRVAVSDRRSLASARSDERLARLVATDGQAPFAELYERYHQALYRYCRSIVRDEHDAQDALQSAMERAFAALRKGERDLAVRPWLFRIAHNESVSLLRRRRPQQTAADELALEAPANASEPAMVLEQRDRLATLLSDLRGLTVRQRSVLVMRELSGLSIAEIAAACSTAPGAVKQTLFEAREALRENERGRAMECEQVRRLIYEEDRRALRGRRLRSHLQACASCQELAEGITARRQDLRLLAPPLPAVAATALLSRLLDTGAGAPAGAAASGSAAAGASQAATAGSGGTGAAAGGAGPAAAGSAASSVAAHAGGAVTAKVLATAAVLVVGAAGVAGVTSSGSHHAKAASNARSPRSAAAQHFAVRPVSGGVNRRALAATRGRRATAAQASNQSRGAAHPSNPKALARNPKGIYHGRSGKAHESPGASASAPGKAKVHPNASHGSSRGHQPQSQHAAHSKKATGKGRAVEHRSPASQRQHASHETSAQSKPKPPSAQSKPKSPKEANDGRRGEHGHGKPATTSGTPPESEAGTVEASSSEHGKGAHGRP